MAGSVRKRGATWYFVVDIGRDEEGKRKQRFRGGFATKKAAEEGLRDFLNRLDSGFLPEADKLTFDEYMKRWQEHHATQVEPKTMRRYAALTRLYLLPRLGSLQLAKIRPAHVQGALDAIDRAPATVRQARAVASKAFRQAVAWQLIPVNPVAATAAPKAERPDLDVPTAEGARRLMAEAEGTMWEMPLFLAAFTGARRGEVLAIGWDQIDFERGRVKITRSLERLDGEFRFKEPKTARSRREVALPSFAVDRLRRWKVEQAERRLIAGSAWHDFGLVCDRGDGQPIAPDSFSKAFKRLARAVGAPNTRLHDLRHTAATLMMEAGVHPSIVSRSLGHASEAFTMSVYGHVRDEMLDQAADALGEAYGTE
jgi:integrase